MCFSFHFSLLLLLNILLSYFWKALYIHTLLKFYCGNVSFANICDRVVIKNEGKTKVNFQIFCQHNGILFLLQFCFSLFLLRLVALILTRSSNNLERGHMQLFTKEFAGLYCVPNNTVCCHWTFWPLYNVPDYYSQVWGQKPEFNNGSLTQSTHENETFENVQRFSARNSSLASLDFLTVLCLKNFEFGVKRSWKGSNFHHKQMKLTFCVLAYHEPKPF